MAFEGDYIIVNKNNLIAKKWQPVQCHCELIIVIDLVCTRNEIHVISRHSNNYNAR